MKALKSIKFLSLSISLLSLTVIYSAVYAQEYDDMYFSKSDRKTVKVEKTTVLSKENKNHNSTNYKAISETTETYSAKNVNPEYIARYKSSESNEINDQSTEKDASYSSQDYFVEGYDKDQYVSDSKKGEIDYAALNKRDQMSYSNYSRSNSSPSWRFSPYMSMGFGGYSGYGGYGYNPYMMGYGSGMTMGIGFGSGFGYSPSMSYNLGMSWGTGYNPWGGYGGYPGSYNPYRRGFYDPWGPSYGYSPYNRGFGYGGGGYCPSYSLAAYGGSNANITGGSSDYVNGRNIQYKARTTRSNSTARSTRTSSDKLRVTSADSKIRVPSRVSNTSASNGRTSKDYSKVQNEYYSQARRNSSSTKRISTSSNSRNSYRRTSTGSATRYASSISNNKPSRSSGYSSGYSRSTSKSSSSYSGNSSGSKSRSSYSSPSKSSSSYSGSSSGSRSSSYSSGSSGSSSSGSRSSSSSRSSGRH